MIIPHDSVTTRGLSYRDSVEKTLGYGVPDYSEDMQEKYGLHEVNYNSISQVVFGAIPGNVFLMNGSYGLMDEFSYWVQLAVPVEGVEYH